MTPAELSDYLRRVAERRLPLSLMIWGPPGIGKSSIVAATADRLNMEFIDLRLSQLAPTDLRGLPVPENGISKWLPPEFLPRAGEGVLFLDEINMAPPAMQGVAQQLILDRRVGSYRVPPGWLIWAAGNRKVDRAMVFDMPSALANRFVHLEVAPDADSFRSWGLANGIAETVLAFLAFRPALAHQIDPKHPAWPSPRSWTMASALLDAGLSIAPAVGEGPAAEYQAFQAVYGDLPELHFIVEGKGGALAFPTETSARYATVVGLLSRATSPEQVVNSLSWLLDKSSGEWPQFFLQDAIRKLREAGTFGDLARRAASNAEIRRFMAENRDLIFEE